MCKCWNPFLKGWRKYFWPEITSNRWNEDTPFKFWHLATSLPLYSKKHQYIYVWLQWQVVTCIYVNIYLLVICLCFSCWTWLFSKQLKEMICFWLFLVLYFLDTVFLLQLWTAYVLKCLYTWTHVLSCESQLSLLEHHVNPTDARLTSSRG